MTLLNCEHSFAAAATFQLHTARSLASLPETIREEKIVSRVRGAFVYDDNAVIVELLWSVG